MPNLYIIAGCNGAGKTTASFTILPDVLNCREFVIARKEEFENIIENNELWQIINRQQYES